MAERPLILIGSTDADYYLLLTHILEVEGYRVSLGRRAEEIVHLSSDPKVTAILLDCRSGETLAVDACRRLKDDPDTSPVSTIALIGPGAESKYIDLLQAGVDESFVRPVTPSSLLTFLRNRLDPMSSRENGSILQFADLELDPARHNVRRAGANIHLGPIEFHLLQFLMKHPGEFCERSQLIEAAWPLGRYVETKTVNVHMGRLRAALCSTGRPDLIRTVRSIGYVLEEEAAKTRGRGEENDAEQQT
jgi:two-component system phosphate regulon response regulator PhoB